MVVLKLEVGSTFAVQRNATFYISCGILFQFYFLAAVFFLFYLVALDYRKSFLDSI